jgi:hypothetical protein
VGGSQKRDNVNAVSIKDVKFLDELHDYRLLKRTAVHRGSSVCDASKA